MIYWNEAKKKDKLLQLPYSIILNLYIAWFQGSIFHWVINMSTGANDHLHKDIRNMIGSLINGAAID